MLHTAHVRDEALHLENVRQLFHVLRVYISRIKNIKKNIKSLLLYSSHSYTLVCTFKLGNCTTCNLQALFPVVSTIFPNLSMSKVEKNRKRVYSVLDNLIFFHLLLILTVLRLFTILFRSSELIAQLRSENIKLREKLEETEEKLEVIWKTVY